MPSSSLMWSGGVYNLSATVSSKVQDLTNAERKPALLDNVFQIFSAPLFVIIELFDLIGIRTSEMKEWKKQIEKNVAEFRSRQKSH